MIDHIAELDELVGSEVHLAGIPEVKRKHFAAEARALDASELRKFRAAKRYAVLVCLIHRARVQTRDDLAEMFIKRMGNIHNRGREELERLRARYREDRSDRGDDVGCGPRPRPSSRRHRGGA